MDSEKNSNYQKKRWYSFFIEGENRWFFAVLSAVVIPGLVVAMLVPEIHRSRATVTAHPASDWKAVWSVGREAFGGTGLVSDLAYLNTEAASVSSRDVLYQVVDSEGLVGKWRTGTRREAVDQLSKVTFATVRPGTRLIDIRVSSRDGEQSAHLANLLATRYVENANRQAREKIESTIESVQSPGMEAANSLVLSEVVGRLEDARLRSMTGIESARIMEKADVSLRPVFPNFAILIPSLLIVGSLAGGLTVFLLKRLTRSESDISRLEKKFQTGPVTIVPQNARVLIHEQRPHGSLGAPYRDLCIRLDRMRKLTKSRMVCVVAPQRGEGAAVCSLNLASVFADSGKSVLLIDADTRKPVLHKALHAANHPGLSDYLSGEMRLEETVVKSIHHNLWFMPSGPQHADTTSLLTSKRMDDLVSDMKARFDYVLILSPAMSGSADATALTGYADDTIIVSGFQRHRGTMLVRMKQVLEAAGGVIAGLMLTGVPIEVPTPQASAPVIPTANFPKQG